MSACSCLGIVSLKCRMNCFISVCSSFSSSFSLFIRLNVSAIRSFCWVDMLWRPVAKGTYDGYTVYTTPCMQRLGYIFTWQFRPWKLATIHASSSLTVDSAFNIELYCWTKFLSLLRSSDIAQRSLARCLLEAKQCNYTVNRGIRIILIFINLLDRFWMLICLLCISKYCNSIFSCSFWSANWIAASLHCESRLARVTPLSARDASNVVSCSLFSTSCPETCIASW